jgi:hypothetical protein
MAGLPATRSTVFFENSSRIMVAFSLKLLLRQKLKKSKRGEGIVIRE